MIRELLRERWKLALTIVGVALIAVVWAIFPSIQGAAPDRLTSGPLVVSEVDCFGCKFFDIEAAEIDVENGAYAHQSFREREHQGDPIMWALLDPLRPAILDFSVGNTTEDQNVLIRGIELELLDYEAAPRELSLGCLPSRAAGIGGGIPAEAVHFSFGLEPSLEGNARTIPHDQESSVGLELPPSQLQAYRGELEMSESGVYTLGVSMEYETNTGETRSADSALVDLLVIDPSSDYEIIPPDTGESCDQVTPGNDSGPGLRSLQRHL